MRQPARCGPEIMINIIIDRMERIDGGLDSRMFVLIKLTARDLPNQQREPMKKQQVYT